jgi:hypothetical protein
MRRLLAMGAVRVAVRQHLRARSDDGGDHEVDARHRGPGDRAPAGARDVARRDVPVPWAEGLAVEPDDEIDHDGCPTRLPVRPT